MREDQRQAGQAQHQDKQRADQAGPLVDPAPATKRLPASEVDRGADRQRGAGAEDEVVGVRIAAHRGPVVASGHVVQAGTRHARRSPYGSGRQGPGGSRKGFRDHLPYRHTGCWCRRHGWSGSGHCCRVCPTHRRYWPAWHADGALSCAGQLCIEQCQAAQQAHTVGRFTEHRQLDTAVALLAAVGIDALVTPPMVSIPSTVLNGRSVVNTARLPPRLPPSYLIPTSVCFET